MTSLPFVVAGYGVILGGLALYAAILARRIRVARETSLRIRRDAGSTDARPGETPTDGRT